MCKKILSIIEGILAGILIWKVFIPTFIELSKTEIGNWAYGGLISFILIIIGLEYRSYKEDKLTWLASQFFGNLID